MQDQGRYRRILQIRIGPCSVILLAGPEEVEPGFPTVLKKDKYITQATPPRTSEFGTHAADYGHVVIKQDELSTTYWDQPPFGHGMLQRQTVYENVRKNKRGLWSVY